MNKQKRQEKVLEIVTKTEVDTQEELIKILEDQGLKVTQATVSRDIKELGLVKVSGKIKKYRYFKPTNDRMNDESALIRHFRSAIVSVNLAQNMLVIKTLSGNANAVGAVIDGRALDCVLGTIAGDDTLVVISADVEGAKKAHDLVSDIFQL